MIRSVLVSMLLAIFAGAPAVSAQDYSSSDREFYGGDYQVVSRMNDLCLNVSGGRIYEGAVLITWDCVGAPNEKFRAQRSGSRGSMRMTIAGADGLYCVQGSSERGRQMTLARCDGSVTQTFRFSARSPYAITNTSDYCVNIEGQRRVRGTRVISWPCSGEPNEGWEFRRVY